MTPDVSVEPLEPQSPTIPSTAGMTTRVVKGSLWTLAGSVLPLGVSFISTPFIIRFLGTESYGVLLLVGLIPSYFSFADFGMGVASTRFASEAFGLGEPARESEFVWTAVFIATASALLVAFPIFILSDQILRYLNVPDQLLPQATIALKLTAVAFVVGIWSGVFNSPMLARLRMDLNTITSAVPKILLATVTPVILYFGGGLIGAASWTLTVTIATTALVFYFSMSLLPVLYRISVKRHRIRALLNFGGAWVIAMIAAMFLSNFEKLALTGMVSVRALAYYSVAFTLASMATTFSAAMLQSLVPAFSQMLAPEKNAEFNALFVRGMRLNLILLLPTVAFLLVIAKPFFTLWAGKEFGIESTVPFYLLVLGVFFNILAFIPQSVIVARGRTDVFAKLYWVELGIYAVVAVVLIQAFGIAGAAAAWSVRAIADAFVIMWLAKKIGKVELDYRGELKKFALSAALLVPASFIGIWFDHPYWLFFVAPLLFGLYFFCIWRSAIDLAEKEWLVGRLRSLGLV